MDVREDPETGRVVIDGIAIDGFIDDAKCPHCASYRIYSDDFDAFFCAPCNVWLESVCGDGYCSYCRQRPERPRA